MIVVIRVRTLYYFVIEENFVVVFGVLPSVWLWGCHYLINNLILWRPGIEPKSPVYEANSLSTELLRMCLWSNYFAIQCLIVETIK